MGKRATSIDVARLAGVSQSTVSRVLSGQADLQISEETRALVMDAAQKLGYRANAAARSLVTGRTNTVLLSIPRIHSPVSSHALYYLQRNAKECGFETIVSDSVGYSGKTETFALGRESRWPVDGAVVMDNHLTGASVGEAAGMPVVCMGTIPSDLVDCVSWDVTAGPTMAVEHLVEVGCRRIAFVTPTFMCRPDEPRHDCYLEVLRRHGLEPEFVPISDHTRRRASIEFAEYVQRNGLPEGVFAYDDNYAIGIHAAILGMGRRMPDDIALVGFDGIEDTEFMHPQISTVVQPLEEMCRLAWEYLHSRMLDGTAPRQHRVLAPTLAVRASSAKR